MNYETIIGKVERHTPTVLGSKNFSKYAIFLPLIEKDGEICVLFEVRAQSLRNQPGEICFPGGRIDPQDESEKHAALRETEEELGIRQEDIFSVHALDYIVSPFGMIIYSYAGFINPSTALKPNPAEVAEVFTVPLNFLMETKPRIYQIKFEVQPEEDFPYDLITGGENYNWRTRQADEYFYIYKEKVIWGLTARIVAHFIEILR